MIKFQYKTRSYFELGFLLYLRNLNIISSKLVLKNSKAFAVRPILKANSYLDVMFLPEGEEHAVCSVKTCTTYSATKRVLKNRLAK